MASDVPNEISSYGSSSVPRQVICSDTITLTVFRAFLNEVCTDIILFKNQKLVYYRGGYSSFKALHAKHVEQMKNCVNQWR